MQQTCHPNKTHYYDFLCVHSLLCLLNYAFLAKNLYIFCFDTISGMVQEVHKAQRRKEEAMMGRIKVANQERDEALFRLSELERRYEEYVTYIISL